MLHVEGRDPAGRRARLADHDTDVDEQLEVDLVAAELLGHERPEHARALERVDHVVRGLALRLRFGGALRDQGHDRTDAFEEARSAVRRIGHVGQLSTRSAASATSESSE